MTHSRGSHRENALFAVAMGILALHATVDSFLAPGAWDAMARSPAARIRDARGPGGGRRARPAARRRGAELRSPPRLVYSQSKGRGSQSPIRARSAPAGRTGQASCWHPSDSVSAASQRHCLWRSRKPGRLRYLRRSGSFSGALSRSSGSYCRWPWQSSRHIDRALSSRRRVWERRTTRDLEDTRRAGSRSVVRALAEWSSGDPFPTRKGKLPQARMLVRHGFGVLLLDARGYDGSDGDSNVFGWGSAKDIDAAVAWLRQQPDVHDGRVGGIGFSVGGEMMLEAAADNAGLRAVVSEGAGARSIREDLIRGPRGWLVVPQAAVQTTALAVLSGTTPPPSLQRLVGRISPRPLYLIYAGRSSAGEDLNLDYFRSASEPKTLWKIPRHATSAASRHALASTSGG